jgi:AmiR/NasT family two-component response regulator
LALSQTISDLRDLRILVVHPPDDEARRLSEHLKRIGCKPEMLWPPPRRFETQADVVLLAFDPTQAEAMQRLTKQLGEVTLLAITDYENPRLLQAVLESGALAVIEKPVRPFGLLTNLVLARSLWLERRGMQAKVDKLERKLVGIRKINRAKAILIEQRGLSEDAAHKVLRDQAMTKRMTMEDMATAIINANEVLNSPSKPD